MSSKIIVSVFLIFVSLYVCFVKTDEVNKDDVVTVDDTATKDNQKESITRSESESTSGTESTANDGSVGSGDPGDGDNTSEDKSEVSVLSLSSSDFDDVIQKHDTILVEFFAPWYVDL